jgi:hypothetical protein
MAKYGLNQINSLIYGMSMISQIFVNSSIILWNDRANSFVMIQFFYFLFIIQLLIYIWLNSFENITLTWVYLSNGLFMVLFMPFALNKWVTFDPLDKGIIINEASTLMNNIDPSRNWNGV